MSDDSGPKKNDFILLALKDLLEKTYKTSYLGDTENTGTIKHQVKVVDDSLHNGYYRILRGGKNFTLPLVGILLASNIFLIAISIMTTDISLLCLGFANIFGVVHLYIKYLREQFIVLYMRWMYSIEKISWKFSNMINFMNWKNQVEPSEEDITEYLSQREQTDANIAIAIRSYMNPKE